MDWKLDVLEWIVGWGVDWEVGVDGVWLVVVKGDVKKEEVELWKRFKIVMNRWKKEWGGEFEEGEKMLKVFNGYGKNKWVRFNEEELKKVLKYGV